MFPYNVCENKWLSNSRKKVKKHFSEYEPVYAVIAGVIAIALFVLAVITSISSFA